MYVALNEGAKVGCRHAQSGDLPAAIDHVEQHPQHPGGIPSGSSAGLGKSPDDYFFAVVMDYGHEEDRSSMSLGA